jgi:hypothetical protein
VAALPFTALLAPPPFDPAKLRVAHAAGCCPLGPAPPDAARRYTLTHNDLTGSLTLTIGPAFNDAQLSGWYVRLLRDEVLAEWRMGADGGAELHVACHVSGATAWLAPPRLRSLIFQREMALVLDVIAHAERDLLASHPHLTAARVVVALDSHLPRYAAVLPWGTIGDRAGWRAAPPITALLSDDDWEDVGATPPAPGWGMEDEPPAAGGGGAAADAAGRSATATAAVAPRRERGAGGG